MKNLENFGVQELSAREIENIDGGWIRWAVAIGLAILNTDWDEAASDFSRGFNA
jgi:hypothetical protein